MSDSSDIAASEMRKRMLAIALVLLGVIVAIAGGVLLIEEGAEGDSLSDVERLREELLIADSLPGLQETELRTVEGGETLSKPVATKAFRFFEIHDDLTVEEVKERIIETAEADAWEFEREGLSQENTFRMSKTIADTDLLFSLFVEVYPSTVKFVITVENQV